MILAKYMSEIGYLNKVEMGLTGPESVFPVCEPTALERISPHHDLRPATYFAKIGYHEYTAQHPGQKRRATKMYTHFYDLMAQDIGLDDHKDIGFERVGTERELKLLLRHLFLKDCLIILDVDAPFNHQGDPDDEVVAYDPTDEPHAAGLIPLSFGSEPTFLARSSWLPRDLEGELTAEDLFGSIVHHRDRYLRQFRFNDANVSFYPHYRPPEQRRDVGDLPPVDLRKGILPKARDLTACENRLARQLQTEQQAA